MILKPNAGELARATEALDAFLDAEGGGPRARMALETVLEEVFMNIVNHSGATYADFTVRREGDAAVLRFEDDGVPFDPLAREDPDVTLPAHQREIGGLGVLMVRRMTDRQLYARDNGRNVLTLARSLG